jgi:dTMP kinase
MKTNQKGKLIVIDGKDGSGKATQTKLLVARLVASGRTASSMDFPRYDTNFFGKFIRECLDGKHGDFLSVDPYLASIPYANDRRESKPEIERLLAEGDLVFDRYVSANMLHQGGKIRNALEREKYLHWVDRMEFVENGLPRPDITIYLNLDVSVSMKLAHDRAKAKGEASDKAEENARHQHETQESAISIIDRDKSWILIDCNDGVGGILSPEVIHAKVWDSIQNIIAA